jgi:hypothetical protein
LSVDYSELKMLSTRAANLGPFSVVRLVLVIS